MKNHLPLTLLIMSAACGCTATRFDATDRLINSAHNVARQIAYVESTRQELARHVADNQPDFTHLKPLTYVSDDGATNFYFHARDAWLPVGPSGWFVFRCHSMHAEFNRQYLDVGDLSIGMDNAGQYYFNRTHVCGSLSFAATASGHFSDIGDFLNRNPSWLPLPDDWKHTVPCAPDVDITSYVVGNWRGTAARPDGTDVETSIEFTDYDLAHVDIGTAMSCMSSYTIVSAHAIEFQDAGFIGGKLSLDGTRLRGTISQPVEDDDEMDRLMASQKTNAVEVVYSHTNTYTGVWSKVPPKGGPKPKPQAS